MLAIVGVFGRSRAGKDLATRIRMLLVCDHCDTVQTPSGRAPTVSQHCARCDHELYVPKPARLDHMLALALTGIVAFVISNTYPVVTLSAHGRERSATLLLAVSAAADQGAIAVAVITLVATFVLPLTELLLYTWVLLALREHHVPRGFRSAMHTLRAIRHWSMVEVFLLAVIVAAVKLGDLATVTPGIGVFALFVLTCCVGFLRRFDLRDLWTLFSRETGARAL